MQRKSCARLRGELMGTRLMPTQYSGEGAGPQRLGAACLLASQRHDSKPRRFQTHSSGKF